MSALSNKSFSRPEVVKGGKSEIPARLVTPFEEMDRMFDRYFSGFLPRSWLRPLRSNFPELGDLETLELRAPKVDIVERDDEIVVRAEIPGISKDDLDISVTDSSVTIKGSTKHEEKEEKGDYYRKEISQASFARTVALPNYVDADNVKAVFNDGVLELKLPKVTKSKRRTITVE